MALGMGTGEFKLIFRPEDMEKAQLKNVSWVKLSKGVINKAVCHV